MIRSLNSKILLLTYAGLFAYVICNGESNPLEGVENIFEALGYSPSCVAVALASCAKDSLYLPLLNNSKKSYVLQTKMLNEQLQTYPRNCADLQAQGDVTSGVRTVYPFSCCTNRPVTVFCDQTTDGGGWTVIQRRDALPQREDFYRTWIEYVLGFGNLTGEFWLGLENIHALVNTNLMELRVDLEDFEEGKRWAKYGKFYVGDSQSKFILSIGRYSGGAGDGLAYHNGFRFSTHDMDNDNSTANLAQLYRGAWWYNQGHHSNLNGFQYVGTHSSRADGVNWFYYKGYYYSMKRAVMNVRPKFKSD